LSPAIADLQFEAPRGIGRPRDYFSVLKAFAGALCNDAAGDLISLKDDVSMIVLLTTLQASYYSFMLILLSGFGAEKIRAIDLSNPALLTMLWYVTGILVACALTSMACHWPARRATRLDPATSLRYE